LEQHLKLQKQGLDGIRELTTAATGFFHDVGKTVKEAFVPQSGAGKLESSELKLKYLQLLENAEFRLQKARESGSEFRVQMAEAFLRDVSAEAERVMAGDKNEGGDQVDQADRGGPSS